MDSDCVQLTNTTAHSSNSILISLRAFSSVIRVTLRSSHFSVAYTQKAFHYITAYYAAINKLRV